MFWFVALDIAVKGRLGTPLEAAGFEAFFTAGGF